jgi:glc operon protein GlcG
MATTLPFRTISLAGAQLVIDAATAEATARGFAMCFTVCDPAGVPVISVRMDGAPRLSAEIAGNKAYSVASFKGMPTDRWWPGIKDDPALVHGITHTARLTIFGGGVPLVVDGEIVGALGVSGGSADEDRLVAEAAANVL